ncbi:LysR family transcriptional regulator [Vibrio rotiferianus]|uniref:LysR family transcriptional regulator n=1 Tax=Vibrio rotiferianus TaxID=190895 RepID=UPI00406A2399
MLRHLASHLPYFSAVAKNLSFSKGADELSISQSSISYQIKSLEEKLGFKLFVRGQGSKVELTTKGKSLYQEYGVLERNFNQVVSDTQLNTSRTKLEITAPIDFGIKLLTPALSQLETDKLIVNLDLTDNVIDLKQSRFDFSIRNKTDENGLEYIPLIALKNLLFCSQFYADSNNVFTFSHIKEHHRLIVRNAIKSNTWEQLFHQYDRSFVNHKNMQVINNSFGIYQAIVADAGIGILPEYFLEQTNYQKFHIFDEPLNETQFFLAFQPSYIAKKWAVRIKDHLIESIESQRQFG